MYRYLRGEMIKKKLTYEDISKLLKVSYTTVGNKFNGRGKSDFSISEANLIRNEFFPDEDIEKLFKRS